MRHKPLGKGSLALFVLLCFFHRLPATDGNYTDTMTTIKIPLRRMKLPKRTIQKREIQTYRDNLQGRPGQGYYIAIQLGTPPQLVSFKCSLKSKLTATS